MHGIDLLYKGAGPGSVWHNQDARLSGFTCSPLGPTIGAVYAHIVRASHPSPFISFTSSFAVARSYALTGKAGRATSTLPGKVYVLDVSTMKTQGVRFLDPIEMLVNNGNQRFHSGGTDLVPAIAVGARTLITASVHHTAHVRQPPSVPAPLYAITFALRDAELLAVSQVPAACIHSVEDVW